MKQFKRIEPTTIQEVGLRFKTQVVIKRYQTEDGLKHEFTTAYKEHSSAGAVIALTKDKKAVVVHQFRAGPERWMYELPGGSFNDGEDKRAAALRELKEETGYVPGTIEFLGESCREAYCNCTWYYYLATDCELSGAGDEQDEEEHDQGAEVMLISIDELIDNAKRDRMTDPHAVLMAYERLKEIQAND